MIRAYSVADVRAAEADEMKRQPQGELMSRAAQGLVDVVLARRVPDGDRVVVLVGSGDNGGDALYAAGSLALADLNVMAVLVGSRAHPGGLEYARTRGVSVIEWPSGSPGDQVRSVLAEADLVIDGIAGIGGRPGLPDHLRELPDLIADTAYVIAVDLPSGCDPAGMVGAASIFADETVTFSMAKPVHLMPATEWAVGMLTVADIGVAAPAHPAVERLTRDDVVPLWPVPLPSDDKYSRGVLGVVTGSEKYPGAAVMSVTAAVTAGVGMVRYVGPQAPSDLVSTRVPEAVMGEGRCQAWLIGSGLEAAGADEAQLAAAHTALASPEPVLLDAGGLDLIEQPRSAPTLLTPHAGELARLADRLGIPSDGGGVPLARQVADRLQATVLLKGAVTAIVPPQGAGLPVRTQSDAPSWLATAGAGDVLAGICGALLSAGLSPLDAGSLGALVHGVAADDANPGGPVRAMDVAHQVGRTVARLLRNRD